MFDVAAMQVGARKLGWTHGFTSDRCSRFKAKSAVRTLDGLEVARVDEEIIVEARARSFLHHQVRNIVGTLKLVGLGKWSPLHVRRALEAKVRRAGGPTAPAQGLCLVAVNYPT